MLKKLAAVLLLIGLCTPYSCDVRPVTLLVPKAGGDPWSYPATLIPVLAAIAYVALSLLPGAGAWIGRRAGTIRGVLAVLFGVMAGAWLVGQIDDMLGRERIDVSDLIMLVARLAWSVGLLLWTRRRGAAADPVPMTLLAILGLPVVFCFYPPSELRYGGWILTAGYFLAVIAEAQAFPRAPARGAGGPIAHGPGAG